MLVLLSGWACSTSGESGGAEPTAWYYPDEDGDGWGDDAGAVDVADRPGGWVDRGGDCDDGDVSIHPEAEEVCDGVDDDCDGAADDGATDATTLYTDADGDGAGDPATAAMGCPGDGLVAEGDDCDDGDASVSPTAPELCGDGTDDDCDGTAAGCSLSGELDLSLTALRVDQAGVDGFDAALAPGDLTGDGVGDLVLTESSTTVSGAADSGVVWVLPGPVSAGTADALATAWLYSDQADSFGDVLAAGDLDGDAALDLVVGSPYATTSPGEEGRVQVYLGPLSSGATPASAATVELVKDAHSAWPRWAVLGPDLDGDGAADLVTVDPSRGAALYSGPAATPVATLDPEANDLAAALSPGDLDGDGLPDLLLAASEVPLPDSAYGDEAAVFLFPGPVAGSLGRDDAALTLTVPSGIGLERLVATGDLDEDGRPDFAATTSSGTVRNGSTGGAWFWTDTTAVGTPSLSSAAAILAPSSGTACASDLAAGDLDGDGHVDVFIGGARLTTDSAYVGWVLTGPLPTGHVAAEEAAAASLELSPGNDYEAACDAWKPTIGDVSGDGRADLVLAPGKQDVGAAFVLGTEGL